MGLKCHIRAVVSEEVIWIIDHQHTCPGFVHPQLAQQVSEILLAILVLLVVLGRLGVRLLVWEGGIGVYGLAVGVGLVIYVQHADGGLDISIVHVSLTVGGGRIPIWAGLVDAHGIGVRNVVGVDGRDIFVGGSGHVMLHGNLLVVIVVATPTTLIFDAFWLKGLAAGRKVAVVVDGGGDAVQLQADAGRTGPGIRRGGVAFDLPAAASFTGSHHYAWVVSFRECPRGGERV
jgi:hypothetical protein